MRNSHGLGSLIRLVLALLLISLAGSSTPAIAKGKCSVQVKATLAALSDVYDAQKLLQKEFDEKQKSLIEAFLTANGEGDLEEANRLGIQNEYLKNQRRSVDAKVADTKKKFNKLNKTCIKSGYANKQ